MLISTAGLDSILNDPGIVLVDVRSFKEYSEGHVPGAVHLDLFAFHWIDTTRRGIENFNDQSRSLLSFVGAAPEKTVVFYDSVSGMLAARGVWMTAYLSHQKALMLDGGISKWRREGLPLETKPNGFRPSEFSGTANPGLVSGFAHVRESLEGAVIIDARSPGEYDGSVVRAARGGHIPNAVNIDWRLNLAEDGTLKSDEDLSEIYGMPKHAQIITYCQGAYRAANTFLALKKLGFDNVRVYLGSWGEWGNRLDLPISK